MGYKTCTKFITTILVLGYPILFLFQSNCENEIIKIISGIKY